MIFVIFKGSIIVKNYVFPRNTHILTQRYTNCATPLDILITWKSMVGGPTAHGRTLHHHMPQS